MPKIEPNLSTRTELDTDQTVAMTLEAATLANRALRAGSTAPTFRLRGFGEQRVSLHELIGTGPVVVHFYRGSCQHNCDSFTSSAVMPRRTIPRQVNGWSPSRQPI